MKKVVLFSVLALSVGSAFADTIGDITNRDNYLPGGKYRVYGPGRGDVAKLTGSVHRFGAPNIQRMGGGLEIEHQKYQGVVHYEQQFDNHGWRQHSPFHSQQIVTVPVKGAGITANGTNVSNFTIIAKEIHPDDGYDGEQGGGYPAPKGARDIYNYQVKGTVKTTRLTNLDVPYIPITPENNPFKNNADNSNNGQPEKNSGEDNRSRDNHDLAGSDNPNMPNNSADNQNSSVWQDILSKTTFNASGAAGIGVTGETKFDINNDSQTSYMGRTTGAGFDLSASWNVYGERPNGRTTETCGSAAFGIGFNACKGYSHDTHETYGTFDIKTGLGAKLTVNDGSQATSSLSPDTGIYYYPSDSWDMNEIPNHW